MLKVEVLCITNQKCVKEYLKWSIALLGYTVYIDCKLDSILKHLVGRALGIPVRDVQDQDN